MGKRQQEQLVSNFIAPTTLGLANQTTTAPAAATAAAAASRQLSGSREAVSESETASALLPFPW